MNAVIARGGLSHVAFFHESAQRAPARYAINATFCAIDTPQGKRWLFEDDYMKAAPLMSPGFERRRPADCEWQTDLPAGITDLRVGH